MEDDLFRKRAFMDDDPVHSNMYHNPPHAPHQNYSQDYPPPRPGYQQRSSHHPYHDAYSGGPKPPHTGYGMENNIQRYERDMSTDEGENTSNDAGDISSSEASGSGRRRKNKSLSPKSPVHAHQEAKASPGRDKGARKSDYRSPEKKISEDLKHQPMSSTPRKESIVQKIESPKLEVIKKGNSPTQEEEPKQEAKLSQSLSKGSNKEKDELKDLKEIKANIPKNYSNNDKEELEKEKTEYKKEAPFVPVSNAVAVDQNFMTESGDEDAKLYSSESETSSQEVAPAKKVSAERERKVGVGAQNTNNAYQQMLLGGSKKSAPPVTFDDESTSDDLEAQFSFIISTA